MALRLLMLDDSTGAVLAPGSYNPAPQPAWTYNGALSLQAGTSAKFYNDTGRTLTIQSVRASMVTAPAGSNVIVDVNKNGTTIFTTQSNRPTIATGALTTKVTSMDVTTWENGTYLSPDVDQIGTSGATLTIQVVAV